MSLPKTEFTVLSLLLGYISHFFQASRDERAAGIGPYRRLYSGGRAIHFEEYVRLRCVEYTGAAASSKEEENSTPPKKEP